MKKLFLATWLLAVVIAPVLAAGVTFTIPAGGETWMLGSMHTITYTYTAPMADDCVTLHRNGVLVGYIFHSGVTYNPGSVVSHPWMVGKLVDLENNVSWAPPGSGYTIRAGQMAQSDHGGFSNPFTIGIDLSAILKIRKILYVIPPQPGRGGCPQCLTLDLGALREELGKLNEPLTAELLLRGKLAVSLGRGFASRLQVRFEPWALEALKRGEEFELRLLNSAGQQVHAQAIRLTAGR